jgi:hypothetical protein
MSQNSRDQGFAYVLFLLDDREGSGSVPLTDGSGSATQGKRSHKTKLRRCPGYRTKEFLKGWKSGLFVNFGRFLASGPRIRISNSNSDPGEPNHILFKQGLQNKEYNTSNKGICEKYKFSCTKCLVLRVRDVYSGSRILILPDPGSNNNKKQEGEKSVVSPFFVAI